MQYNLTDFIISDKSKERFNDLIYLIIQSVTIETKQQKQYWIEALDTMTDDQLENLKKILSDERDELKKIDKQYEEKVEQAETDAIAKIKLEESSAKRRARLSAESEEELNEKKVEEDLLKRLEDIDS